MAILRRQRQVATKVDNAACLGQAMIAKDMLATVLEGRIHDQAVLADGYI